MQHSRQKHCVAHHSSISPTMQAPCNWALCVLPDPLHDRVPISIMWSFRFACCNVSRLESFRVSSCLACCHPSSYGFLAFPPWEAAGRFLRLLLTGCFLAGVWLSLSLSMPSEAAAPLVPFFASAFFLAGFLLLPLLLLLMPVLLLVVLTAAAATAICATSAHGNFSPDSRSGATLVQRGVTETVPIPLTYLQ